MEIAGLPGTSGRSVAKGAWPRALRREPRGHGLPFVGPRPGNRDTGPATRAVFGTRLQTPPAGRLDSAVHAGLAATTGEEHPVHPRSDGTGVLDEESA